MEFLHQWYGEDNCTYGLVDKHMSAAVITIGAVEWQLKTGQVSPL